MLFYLFFRFDLRGLEARRTWAFDQLVALIRNGAIPKDDSWVASIVEFFVLHGLYKIKTVNPKSPFVHVSLFVPLRLEHSGHWFLIVWRSPTFLSFIPLPNLPSRIPCTLTVDRNFLSFSPSLPLKPLSSKTLPERPTDLSRPIRLGPSG